MNRRRIHILLVILLLVAVAVFGGCRQKYQYQTKEEITIVRGVPGLNVTVTGPCEELKVTLISPDGTSVIRDISYSMMVANLIVVANTKHREYDMNNGLAVVDFPLGDLGEYTLIIKNGKGEKVYQGKIGLIRLNGEVSIAKE
jgi:hypothetical protein